VTDDSPPRQKERKHKKEHKPKKEHRHKHHKKEKKRKHSFEDEDSNQDKESNLQMTNQNLLPIHCNAEVNTSSHNQIVDESVVSVDALSSKEINKVSVLCF
jgi:hypothetical protein